MASAPIITYDVKVISPGYNLHVTSSGSSVTATYDDFPTDASGIVAHCSISVAYTNIKWVLNNDNSVTVTGEISGGVLTRTATGTSSSQHQAISTKFNGIQTFSQTVSSASSGTYDLNIPSSFSVTVPPSLNPQPQGPAAIKFKNDNTASTSAPDEFYVGILIKNPNPPDYRPGQCLHSGTWQSHNRSGGSANVLRSGTWTEMRTINGGDASGDPPTIRTNGSWKNQRKIGANA